MLHLKHCARLSSRRRLCGLFLLRIKLTFANFKIRIFGACYRYVSAVYGFWFDYLICPTRRILYSWKLMDCNSCQLPPPVPVVSRTHHKDAKLSQGEMPIVQEVAWAKGKGKAFKSFFTPFTHTHKKNPRKYKCTNHCAPPVPA